MNWQQFFNGFDFNDNRIFYNQIHFVRGLEFDALIIDRQVHLPLKLKTYLTKFITKTFFINRFQQAGPQMPMNLNRGANDPIR
jgi:hypothetical protein